MRGALDWRCFDVFFFSGWGVLCWRTVGFSMGWSDDCELEFMIYEDLGDLVVF